MYCFFFFFFLVCSFFDECCILQCSQDVKACSPKAGSEGKAESPSGSATSFVRLVFREGGISGERSRPVVSSAEVEGAFKRFGVRAAWSRHQDQSDI